MRVVMYEGEQELEEGLQHYHDAGFVPVSINMTEHRGQRAFWLGFFSLLMGKPYRKYYVTYRSR